MASKGMLCLLENANKVCKSKLPAITVPIRRESSQQIDNQETHTGQKFDNNDYRLVRFVDRPKVVNPNWGINLIAEVPPAPVKDRIVSCDGGGPLGHPKVYINLDKPGNHACGYCGLRFYKEDHH